MPGYPYPPQPNYPPPQKPTSDWVYAIRAGVIVVSLLLGGGLFAGFLHLSHNTISPTSIPASSPSAPVAYGVGQQASVGYWQVTINSVKTHRGDAVSTPKVGNVYLVIDVTVVNISARNQLMASGYYFTLTDSTGQPYNEQFTDFGQPPEGTIIPTGKLRGQLIYEVPTTEHEFTLQVQGDLSHQNVAIWTITD